MHARLVDVSFSGLPELFVLARTCHEWLDAVRCHREFCAAASLMCPASRPNLPPSHWVAAHDLLLDYVLSEGSLAARLELGGIDKKYHDVYLKHPRLQMRIRRSPAFGLLLDLKILAVSADDGEDTEELPPEWPAQAQIATHVDVVLEFRSKRYSVFQAVWSDAFLNFWTMLGEGLSWLWPAFREEMGIQGSSSRFYCSREGRRYQDLWMCCAVPASRLLDLVLGGGPPAAPRPVMGPAPSLHVVGAFFDVPKPHQWASWPKPYPQDTVRFTAQLGMPEAIPPSSACRWRGLQRYFGNEVCFPAHGLGFVATPALPDHFDTMREYLAVWVLDSYGRTQFEAPCIKLRSCSPKGDTVRPGQTFEGACHPAEGMLSSEAGPCWARTDANLNVFMDMVVRFRMRSRTLQMLLIPPALDRYFDESWKASIEKAADSRCLAPSSTQWDSDSEEERMGADGPNEA